MTYYRIFFLNILFILALTCAKKPGNAEELPVSNAPSTVNPPSVVAPPAPISPADLIQKPVVIELFTSLDCLFCPKAEKTLADMAQAPSAIILSCYTDPETRDYPIAQEFCTARQERYSATLSDGLMYTPQMVFNGHIDAVGHQPSDVMAGLKQTSTDIIAPIIIRPGSDASTFLVDVPALPLPSGVSADIFMMTYRPPYTVPKTMRQSTTHPDPLIHVAHRFIPLGPFQGTAKTITVPFTPGPDDAGFIVMIERSDNRMIAAGTYSGPTP